jgi:hypothetical protein
LVKNGVATSVSCSLSGNPATCSDTINSATFAVGDNVSIQASGVGGAKPVVWTIEYQ